MIHVQKGSSAATDLTARLVWRSLGVSVRVVSPGLAVRRAAYSCDGLHEPQLYVCQRDLCTLAAFILQGVMGCGRLCGCSRLLMRGCRAVATSARSKVLVICVCFCAACALLGAVIYHQELGGNR